MWGALRASRRPCDGQDNPQIYFKYDRPSVQKEPEIGHMREYTAYEIGKVMNAAGFDLTKLFTTVIAEFEGHHKLLKFPGGEWLRSGKSRRADVVSRPEARGSAGRPVSVVYL